MLRRWWAVVSNEFSLLARRPLAWAISGVVPCAVLIFFGFALTSSMKHIPTGFYSEKETKLSEKLLSLLADGQMLQIREYQDETKLKEDIANGRLTVGIILRGNFEVGESFFRDPHRSTDQENSRAHSKNPPEQIQGTAFWAIIEGSDLFVAIAAQSWISQVANKLSSIAANRALQEREALNLAWPVDQPVISAATDIWFNPNLETKSFAVTHLVGVLLTVTVLCLAATSMVGEKESGSLSYLRLSSLREHELLLGKATPYFILGLAMFMFMLTSVWLVFGIRPRGNLAHLLWLSAVYVFGTVMLAMMTSCLLHTQRRVFDVVTAVSIAMLLFSGLIFPVNQMPEWARVIANMDPVFHFNRILFGIVLRGQSVFSLKDDIFFTVSFAVVAMVCALGLCRFRLSTEW